MSRTDSGKDDDQVGLPGFRFHPTDEELVSFYLRKKIDKQLIDIEFIKQVDIYKYDPWDLANGNSAVTDNEWYFFCKRERKYKNSIRPNRVTGSGFWKATGIDKPIYSAEGESQDCIGLKKSLVYYCGSAGKGTKTDWMMHEFRLSADQKKAQPGDQEAEIWTICRVFKRNGATRIGRLAWRDAAAEGNQKNDKSTTCSVDSEKQEGYISFGAAAPGVHEGKKPVLGLKREESSGSHVGSEPGSGSGVLGDEAREFFSHGNWDAIISAMEYAYHP